MVDCLFKITTLWQGYMVKDKLFSKSFYFQGRNVHFHFVETNNVISPMTRKLSAFHSVAQFDKLEAILQLSMHFSTINKSFYKCVGRIGPKLDEIHVGVREFDVHLSLFESQNFKLRSWVLKVLFFTENG